MTIPASRNNLRGFFIMVHSADKKGSVSPYVDHAYIGYSLNNIVFVRNEEWGAFCRATDYQREEGRWWAFMKRSTLEKIRQALEDK